jgi:hypothetical protein
MVGRIVSGTFLASAQDDYICIGFIPDWVRIYNYGHSDEEAAYWSSNMRTADTLAGVSTNDDGTVSADTFETGIQIYRGGDIITSSSTPSTTTCFVRDPDNDKRDQGTGATIDTWTLGSSANRTGNWNDVCNTTYVGEGSKINIDGKWYKVVALTSNGEAANEVTLSEPAASGPIYALTGMYDYIVIASGEIAPAGFWIDSTSDIVNQATLSHFEAGCYV